jgi:hypothetical protein
MLHHNFCKMIICSKCFGGKKSLATPDRTILGSINLIFLPTFSAMMDHCLSAWKTGVYVSPKDFNRTNGIGEYMPMPHRVAIHSDKTGPWLCQLNTLSRMNSDIRQLLIEDVCCQVEYLICILRLYNIYIMDVY